MVVAIIQARLGSTRLPGKVLKPINGEPMLKHIINRLSYCNEVHEVVVATSTSYKDDKLVDWCKDNGICYYRGDEDNVLKRYYDVANEMDAKIIVRVTADDPFKDPIVIDDVIRLLKKDNLDFAYNNSPPSFPEGIDTEVFTFDALSRAYKNCVSDFEKEHVTQFFYHNPSLFRMKNLSYSEDVSSIRLTVDTDEDFVFAEEIYCRLSPNKEMFFLEDILSLLKSHPELLKINESVKRSTMYVKGCN